MTKIIFKGIRFKNFLKSGNTFVTHKFDTGEATLIIGENGKGKSQIVDALSFALFKQPIRKIKLGQIVNSINKKDMLVELVFQARNDTYLIRRGIKPNIFEIHKNGTLIPQPAKLEDYQDMLENDILGKSFMTFKQIDVITKTSYKPFMELGEPDRRKIVEDLLDASIYGVMNTIAKNRLKTVKAEIKALTLDIEHKKSLITMQRKLIERQQDNKQDKVGLIQAQIDSHKENLAGLERRMENAVKERDDAYQELKAVTKYALARTKINESKAAINENERRLASITKKIDGIAALTNCPTCQQHVGDDHKHSINNTHLSEIEEIKTDIAEKNKLIEALIPFETKYSEASFKHDTRNVAISDIESRTRDASRNISQLEDQLVSITQANDTVDEADIVKMKELMADLRDAVSQSDELHKSIELLDQAITITSDSGLKAQLVAKFIPIINQKLNHYLSLMDMFVEFTLDQEFNETIKDRFMDTFSYHSFSEGQKARINIALLLTWRDVAMQRNTASSNILFLDEVFDGSGDASFRTDVMNILNDLTNQGISVFMISHNDGYKELFNNVIEVTTNQNFTEYNKLK